MASDEFMKELCPVCFQEIESDVCNCGYTPLVVTKTRWCIECDHILIGDELHTTEDCKLNHVRKIIGS